MFCSVLHGQQNTHYTQLFWNQGFINPGYAGSDSSGLFNAIAINRTEMSGFEGAPKSTMLNINGPLKIGDINSGVGLSLSSEEVGKYTIPLFNLAYAYRLSTNYGSLGIGVSAGILFSTLDAGGWRYPNSTDDVAVANEKGTKQNFDFGLGAFYVYKNWDFGLSVSHLTQPSITQAEQSAGLTRETHFYGAYNFKVRQFDLKASATAYTDFTSTYVSLGMLGSLKQKYWAGINYNVGNEIGVLAGLTLFKDLGFGYHYGYNTSALSKFSSGTHEIMLNYKFALQLDRGKQKYKSVRYL